MFPTQYIWHLGKMHYICAQSYEQFIQNIFDITKNNNYSIYLCHNIYDSEDIDIIPQTEETMRHIYKMYNPCNGHRHRYCFTIK